jgi:hypothetical protein
MLAAHVGAPGEEEVDLKPPPAPPPPPGDAEGRVRLCGVRLGLRGSSLFLFIASTALATAIAFAALQERVFTCAAAASAPPS